MKKLLIGGGVAAGVIMAAGIVSAQQVTTKVPFSVTLGGEVRYAMGWYSDKTKGNKHLENGLDARVLLQAVHKAQNGLEYGFVGRFRNNEKDMTTMDRKYVYLSGGWGTVNLGDYSGAATLLEVTAPDAGFIQSDSYYAAPNAFTDFGLYDFYFFDEDNHATKLTYMTPVLSGFQAGVSYSPDHGETGRNLIRNSKTYKDVWEFGVGYKGELGPVNLSLGGGYIAAARVDSALAKYEVWNLGAQLGYEKLTVGARYYDAGKLALENAKTTHWDAGVTYAVTEALLVGTTYGQSLYDVQTKGGRDLKDHLWSVGASYTLAPGLALQGDLGFFNAQTAREQAGNSGTVAAMRAFLQF